jgi:hypothetical protein
MAISDRRQESEIANTDLRFRRSVQRLIGADVSPALRIFVRVLAATRSFVSSHPALITFIAAATLLAPLTPYGLDVTDTGFHLANQDMLPALGLRMVTIWPLWWFSDVVGGAWLLLTDHLGLLGARLGWVLAISATSALGVRVVANVYGASVWLIVGGALAALHSAAILVMVVDYYIVPSLIGTLFVLVYLQAIQAAGVRKTCWAVLAGFLLFLVAISRLPAALLLAVPLGHFGWLIWHRTNQLRHSAVRVPVVAVGTALLGLILCAAVFAVGGVLHSYLASVIGEDATTGGEQAVAGFSLVKFFLANVARQSGLLAPYGIGLMVLSAILIEGVRRNLAWLPVVLLAAVYIAGLVVFMPELSAGQACYYIFVLMFAAACLAFGWRDIVYFGPASEARFVLLTAALILPIAIDAGSTLGLLKLCYGGALLFPLAMALAREAVTSASARVCRISLALALLVLPGEAFDLMQNHFAVSVYGDTTRSRLVAEMHSSRLRHVWTTPGRQQSFDGLVDAVERESRPGDRILAYSSLTLINYAARRQPLFDVSWIDILSPNELAGRLAQLCTEQVPALIVRSRGSLMNSEWGSVEQPLEFPLSSPEFPVPSFEQAHRMIDEAVAIRCHAKPVWSNRDFEVLRPSIP